MTLIIQSGLHFMSIRLSKHFILNYIKTIFAMMSNCLIGTVYIAANYCTILLLYYYKCKIMALYESTVCKKNSRKKTNAALAAFEVHVPFSKNEEIMACTRIKCFLLYRKVTAYAGRTTRKLGSSLFKPNPSHVIKQPHPERPSILKCSTFYQCMPWYTPAQ